MVSSSQASRIANFRHERVTPFQVRQQRRCRTATHDASRYTLIFSLLETLGVARLTRPTTRIAVASPKTRQRVARVPARPHRSRSVEARARHATTSSRQSTDSTHFYAPARVYDVAPMSRTRRATEFTSTSPSPRKRSACPDAARLADRTGSSSTSPPCLNSKEGEVARANATEVAFVRDGSVSSKAGRTARLPSPEETPILERRPMAIVCWVRRSGERCVS